MSTIGYIAETVPAKVVRTSGTTLFEIAMLESGDALNWAQIALFNGLTDPWTDGQIEILIPPVFPSATPTGIFGA